MFSLLKAATAKSASLSSPNMGRNKAPPITVHPDPDREKPSIAETSSEQPSTSSASATLSSQPKPQSSTSITSSPASMCPHCKTTMYEISIEDFRDHVASCTRPSTADEGSEISQLTEFHDSEFSPARSNLIDNSRDSIFGSEENEAPAPFDIDVKEPEPAPSPTAIRKKGASSKNVLQKFQYGTRVQRLRPYVNPQSKFDYYNEADGHQQIEHDPEDPENAMKFRFPQLYDIEEFVKYLEDPDEIAEPELYKRTANVSEILKMYQDEFDAIEKEVNAHEAFLKSEQEQTSIRAKEKEAEQKSLEKESEKTDGEFRRRFLNQHFKKLGPGAYQAALEQKDPLARELERLMDYQNNPPKDKKIIKVNYEYAPLPETKLTKDEIDAEKRKRGRLMSAVKFNDMKTADVYGFEYNPHVKYIGAQPLSSANLKRRGVNGADNTENGRLRAQRQHTRKFYEENSAGSDSEGLPAKRMRKPRTLDDDNSVGRSRPTSHSRSGTPTPRTFPSGKKVGRPSKADVLARSKLSNSMIAPSSETPEAGQENSTADESRGAQKLAEDVQEDLQSAAARLINTIPPENGTIAVDKPKNKGGRPRKNKAILDATATLPKKNKGGRPRKHPLPNDTNAEDVETPTKRRRVKKEHDNIMSFGDDNEVLQSTEEYDRRRAQTSESTSRPTTSSSNATASSFGSRRSARPQTQAKTEAREQRALAQAMKRQARAESLGSTATSKRKRNGVESQESMEVTGRGKRTKTAHQPFDPSSSVDAEPSATKSIRGKKRMRGPDEIDEPFEAEAVDDITSAPSKKRIARGAKEGIYDVLADEEDDFNDEVTRSGGRSKRARGDSTSIAVAGPSTQTFSLTPSTDPAPPAKKSRAKYAKAKPVEVPLEEWVPDDRSVDGRHLSLIEDPVEREEVRKRRVKRGKSDKLSASMHARWNDGRMLIAMETRKMNAQEKKMALEATGGQPGPKPISSTAATVIKPVRKNAATSTPASAVGKGKRKSSSALKNKDTAYDEDEAVFHDESNSSSEDAALAPLPPSSARAHAPAPIQTRRMSTRERTKPKKLIGGFDGADDEDDEEIEQQFKSEYDRYQALTSPGTPIRLGKRATRKAINFAENDGGESDDDDYYY